MQKFVKILRILTIPPVMALTLFSILLAYDSSLIGGIWHYLAAVFFICIMPVLGYPLQKFVPYFKTRGREGQRNLAFLLSILGYIGGLIFCLAANSTSAMYIIYWTYFLSVILLTLFNTLTRYKASGHACGIIGPSICLVYFTNPIALISFLVFGIVVWSSLAMKRHTLPELLLGGCASIVAFATVITIFTQLL